VIRLTMSPLSIGKASRLIREGKVVAYPTETVYGLAVDPFSPEAIARLYAVKGRDLGRAVLLLASDFEAVSRAAATITPLHAACMKAFWPGPLSLLFEAAPGLDPALVGEGGTVCIRVSSCEGARELAAASGGLISSTSANLSGQAPALSADVIQLPGLDAILDGGPCADASPSTVYDPVTDRVLREGAIAAETLHAFTKAFHAQA